MPSTATLAPTTRKVYPITPSNAHDWAICGGFFDASSREGRGPGTSYPLQLGSAAHELVAAYDRECASGGQSDATLLARHWRAGRFEPADDGRAREEAGSMLELYARARQAGVVEVLASEHFARIGPRSLDERRSIILSGRIDRVARRADGTLEVLDFKTATILPSEDELRRDPATAAYHLLAEGRFGPGPLVVAQWSLRSDARVEVCLSAADLAAGKDRLRAMVEELASGSFGTTPGVACGYCPARHRCPALLDGPEPADRAW